MDRKKSLSERDIISKFVLPAIKNVGWEDKQMCEEVSFTNGRIFVNGTKIKRGERKRADIILYYEPNIPVAVIEVKDNTHTVGAGIQQALEYARTLDIPVAISSNGDGFVIQYRNNCKSQISNPSNHYPGADERGKTDIVGELIEDRLYNMKDYDRNIVIDERTELFRTKQIRNKP